MSNGRTEPSLSTIKETLEKMLQAVQEEIQKVDIEWTQMCSISSQQQQARVETQVQPARSKPTVNTTSEGVTTIEGLDDASFFNELLLEL